MNAALKLFRQVEIGNRCLETENALPRDIMSQF